MLSIEDDRNVRGAINQSQPPGRQQYLLTMQPDTRLILLSLAVSALADNLALESQSYLAHSSCHTEYDHVTVVKQGGPGVT